MNLFNRHIDWDGGIDLLYLFILFSSLSIVPVDLLESKYSGNLFHHFTILLFDYLL